MSRGHFGRVSLEEFHRTSFLLAMEGGPFLLDRTSDSSPFPLTKHDSHSAETEAGLRLMDSLPIAKKTPGACQGCTGSIRALRNRSSQQKNGGPSRLSWRHRGSSAELCGRRSGWLAGIGGRFAPTTLVASGPQRRTNYRLVATFSTRGLLPRGRCAWPRMTTRTANGRKRQFVWLS